MYFFSSFSRKNTRISPHAPEIFGHFPKNNPIFHPNSQKYNFPFFSKIKDTKANFQPIFHTGHTIRTGPSGNAAGGDIRKNPPHCYFRNNFLLQFGN